MNASDLRPLGIGEILDRAITAYVRWFVPLFVILAIAAVPTAILNLAAGPSLSQYFAGIEGVIAHPAANAADQARAFQQLSASLRPAGWSWLVFVLELALVPISRNAFVVFATRAFDGVPVDVAGAVRAGLPRWLPQVVVAIVFVGIATVAIALAVIVGIAMVLAIALLAFASRVLALIVGIPVAIAGVAAIFVIYSVTYLAWQMASIAVASEESNPIRAIGLGLRRALDRRLIRRSVAVGVSAYAIMLIGAFAVLIFGGLVAILGHLDVLGAAITTVGNVVLDGVTTMFVIAYSRDVRVRREGLDLLTAAGEGTLPA